MGLRRKFPSAVGPLIASPLSTCLPPLCWVFGRNSARTLCWSLTFRGRQTCIRLFGPLLTSCVPSAPRHSLLPIQQSGGWGEGANIFLGRSG